MDIDVSARMAIAVSGGADSMCLALLAKNLNVLALVVDHQLRLESRQEADATVQRLASFGVSAEILTWHHDETPSSNIQAAAREARYRLMSDRCRKLGIKTLLTAHHLDDQAETFLLRLNRGSGLAGLAGMASKRNLEGSLQLVRPFLDLSKQQLIDVLERSGVGWIDDPSNTSETFDRVKARNLLKKPPLEGLNSARLAQTASALGRARRAIEFYVAKWLDDCVVFHEAGFASFSPTSLTTVPEEIGLRALAHLIRFGSGQPYGPRFNKLVRLYEDLAKSEFTGATLSGVCFASDGPGQILVVRELAAAEPRAAIAHTTVWDGRFNVERTDQPLECDFQIGCVGENGVLQIKAESDGQLSIPREAALSAPGYFEGDTLIAAPHLGYGDTDKKLPVLTHRWLTSSDSGKKTYRGVQ